MSLIPTLRETLRSLGPALGIAPRCAQALGLALPVMVINLPHRDDRWRAVSGRMAAIGLDQLARVPAIDGALLDLGALGPLLAQPAELIESAPRSHFTLTRPAIGCFLSHLRIWTWMIDSGIPQVLVLEDDAQPSAAFERHLLSAVVSANAESQSLVLLGGNIMDGLADEPRHCHLARAFYFTGTVAYLITPQAAAALLPHLLPLDGHIDHRISKALIDARRTLAGYYTTPPLFEPDWSLRSDVYVPMAEELAADRQLARLLMESRQTLLAEGRPLLPPYAG